MVTSEKARDMLILGNVFFLFSSFYLHMPGSGGIESAGIFTQGKSGRIGGRECLLSSFLYNGQVTSKCESCMHVISSFIHMSHNTGKTKLAALEYLCASLITFFLGMYFSEAPASRKLANCTNALAIPFHGRFENCYFLSPAIIFLLLFFLRRHSSKPSFFLLVFYSGIW